MEKAPKETVLERKERGALEMMWDMVSSFKGDGKKDKKGEKRKMPPVETEHPVESKISRPGAFPVRAVLAKKGVGEDWYCQKKVFVKAKPMGVQEAKWLGPGYYETNGAETVGDVERRFLFHNNVELNSDGGYVKLPITRDDYELGMMYKDNWVWNMQTLEEIGYRADGPPLILIVKKIVKHSGYSTKIEKKPSLHNDLEDSEGKKPAAREPGREDGWISSDDNIPDKDIPSDADPDEDWMPSMAGPEEEAVSRMELLSDADVAKARTWARKGIRLDEVKKIIRCGMLLKSDLERRPLTLKYVAKGRKEWHKYKNNNPWNGGK